MQITELTEQITTKTPTALRGLKFEPPPRPIQQPITRLTDLNASRHKLVAQMVDTARSWNEEIKNGNPLSLALMSQSAGVGKTHTALSIWWTVCHQCPDGFGGSILQPRNPFWDSSALFARAYEIMLAGEPLNGLIRKNSDFVIIDDLGKEAKPQYVAKDDFCDVRQNVWFSVVNHCYRNDIPLVITTNKTMSPDSTGETLESWIGKYALDRLFEMAPRGYMIDLSSVNSYRREKSGRGNA